MSGEIRGDNLSEKLEGVECHPLRDDRDHNDIENIIIIFWEEFEKLYKEIEGLSYSKRKTDDEGIQAFLADTNLDDALECLQKFPEYLRKERFKNPNLDFCIAVFIGACTHTGRLIEKLRDKRRKVERKKEQEERERLESEEQTREEAENENNPEWLKQEIQELEESRRYMLKKYGKDSSGYLSQTALVEEYREKLQRLECSRKDDGDEAED